MRKDDNDDGINTLVSIPTEKWALRIPELRWHYYLLILGSRVLLEKLTGSQLFKWFPIFYGTRKFFTAFTNARHLSLSWGISIQSRTSYPTSWRSILILSSHLRLGLPGGLFLSGFPTKTLYTHLLSPVSATCSANLILLDMTTRMTLGEEYRSLSSSLCSFLHYPVPSSILGLNILLSTLISYSAYVRPSVWATKFHTHTEQQAKL